MENKEVAKKVPKKNDLKKILEEKLKEKLKTEILKIEKIDCEKIDWYNLKSEVEKIKSNYSDEEEIILLYEFQKRFINKNKSIVNGYDKDIVILKVLEELILNDGLNIGAIHLKEKKYFIEAGVDNAVTKALKVLELYEIVLKQTIGANNEKGYSLNLDKWFNKSRYKIQDYIVLEKLTPVITSFINIGFIDEFNIEKLFDRLSELIEYAILPSILHNKYLDIENIITTAIIDNEEIEILIDEKNKKIKPMQIIFADNSKYVIYQIGNITEKTELYKCRLIEEENYIDFKPININKSMFEVEENQTKPQAQEQIKLFLECDSIIYEYFNMLPLSNMIIYDSEDKQREFMKKYNYDCMPNKFYIEALDFKEKIISVIFHCLENVKIIEPTELNKDIIKRVKTFAKKNNIELCEEDTTPPKEPLKSNDKNDNLNLKNETSTHTNDKNVEVNKDGLVGKIKNSDIGNLDL